ncbi:MAG TPA: hypothetical protein VMJ64_06380 [Anaerolineales bacterium]|nr:hypothetical protein [Anaerolineales bacterium]
MAGKTTTPALPPADSIETDQRTAILRGILGRVEMEQPVERLTPRFLPALEGQGFRADRSWFINN